MYRVGDRVVSVGRVGNLEIENAVGTILSVDKHDCLVLFDEEIGGHSVNDNCWYCTFEKLEHFLEILFEDIM